MKLLIDLRTGEPVLDYNGNLQEIGIERAFNQLLDVLFHTPILEEQDLPTWGLDIRGIFEVSGFPNWESSIKYLIADALDYHKEPLIESVEEIALERDGYTLNVKVHVTSKYGTVANPTVSINE